MKKNPIESPSVIERRDLIKGVAMSPVAAQFAASALINPAAAAKAVTEVSAPYPPARSGLRGQHEGSFEAAHMARDGRFDGKVSARESGEHYDLVIVGSGISGLCAAYFYRKALGDDSKILILDNHDDFGGHAKRNEFYYNGKTYLSYGGTMSVESPFPYSYAATALLEDLGIRPESYERYDLTGTVYNGLSNSVFFNSEHFLQDRIVAGYGEKPWAEFFGEAPLTNAVRADLTRLHTDKKDYLPGMSPTEKAAFLKRISLKSFLIEYAGMLEESLPFFAGMGFRNNKRVDTCPAFEALRLPVFDGMAVAEPPRAQSVHFHFPDGNASIARLLVNQLVPGVFDKHHDQESIVSAKANYGALDQAQNHLKIRLNSMAVRVEHLGDFDDIGEKSVRTVYVQDGETVSVTSANVVLACFNNIIPFIVPDLPQDQREALGKASKVPMQYTNVLIRNRRAWDKLGIQRIQAPNGYHTWATLDFPMKIGEYRSSISPDDPVVVHMVRNPNSPGLPRREQHRLGRIEMLTTPFEEIELKIRDQLQRMLGAGGFDQERDILAITVNRWPHGYAYTPDTLSDPDLPYSMQPHVIGRRIFGRIAIANADAGAAAYTNVSIDQANRAIQEILISRGLT